MFSEWTDPYDIDQYYDDLNRIYQDALEPRAQSATSLPSSLSVQPPVAPKVITKPEAPTGIVVNGGKQEKSSFEVKPHSVFLDGHPVGSQPAYNILRSGPPEEQPRAKEGFPYIAMHSEGENCWSYTTIIIFIAFLFLICLLVQSRIQCANAHMTIRMLMMLQMKKKSE